MPNHPGPTGDGVDAFFARSGFPAEVRSLCWDFVRSRYPAAHITEAKSQGYCSYTFSVGDGEIVQFRPPSHRLNLAIVRLARTFYDHLVPETEYLGVVVVHESRTGADAGEADETPGDDACTQNPSCFPSLYAYAMARAPGVSLAEFRASQVLHHHQGELSVCHNTLLRDFAKFIAAGWHTTRTVEELVKPSLRGRVGSSIKWRLSIMRDGLPWRFRTTVEAILADLEEIEALPLALTHGDIVASNIMVEDAGPGPDIRLTGILDWVEAEDLPFGVGLYGLEELLGRTTQDGSFAYYSDAEALREIFWDELISEVPELDRGTELRKSVDMAHVLGMFLWHGIAFDDGKLDRVVEEGRDEEEIRRLDLFFATARLTPTQSSPA